MTKTTDTVQQQPVEAAAAEQSQEPTAAPEGWVRAKVDLFVGHIRAVAAGDLVHVDTVTNNGWDELVEKP